MIYNENVPLMFVEKNEDGEVEMQLCFRGGSVAYLRGKPGEFVEWATEIIRRVETLFGAQDDWADDFISELKKRHAHENPF